MPLEIRIGSRPLLRTLLCIIGLLGVAHVSVMVLTLGLGYDQLFGLTRLFHLNEESNVPSLYSALALLDCALLLAVVAVDARRARDRSARVWWGLAGLFGFICLDEAVSIHELLNVPLRDAMGTHGGVLHFAWVIPYALLVLGVGFACARFLRRLPRATRVGFIAAGATFIAGAIGMEMLEGILEPAYGPGDLRLELAILAEELMEMLGVAYFLTTLLRYVESTRGALRITLSARATQPVRASTTSISWAAVRGAAGEASVSR